MKSLDEIARMSDDAYLDYIGHYKPGSIREIRLKNFLTYKSCVITPGPRLNVVVGANGTGKSTILNAICLGLGGEPKVLGRAEDVRDFVMHDELVAEIEITLAPPTDQEPHTIKRVIDRRKGSENGKGRGSSSFYLNGNKVPPKEIQELVRNTYSIAIENLCTFLPQDKVGNFSALSPQELLIETEKVLSKDGYYIDVHRDLICQQETIQAGSSDVEALKSKLHKLKHENEQLERAKNLMEEREKALQLLDLLRKKSLWLQFEVLRARAVELKKERAEVKEKLREAHNELEPLQRRLDHVLSQVKRVESRAKSLDDQVKAASREVDKQAKKYEKHDDDIERQLLELTELDEKRSRAEEAVRQYQQRVNDLTATTATLPAKEEVEANHHKAVADRKHANHEYSEAKKRQRQVESQLRNLEDAAGEAQRKVAKLGDAASQRKASVFQHFPHLAKVAKWLDDHRGNFRRPVVGPVAAEITPSSPEAAAFIEQHVPNNTLKAFCVECKEDQDLLYNEVRVKLGIPINILLVRKQLPKPRLYSSDKMRVLQQHGVQGYLDETLTAPDIVMLALISTSQIDRVLVGDRRAYENVAAIRELVTQPEAGQSGLQSFVLCCTSRDNRNFKFQGTKSRYANQVSTRQDDILPGKFLMPGIDPAALQEAEAKLEEAHRSLDECRPLLMQAQKDVHEKETQYQSAQGQCEFFKARLDQWTKFEDKLQVANRKLRDAQKNAASDDTDTKRTLVATLMNRVVHSINALEVRAQHQAIMMKATAEALGVAANKSCLVHACRMAELAHVEKKHAYQDLETEAVRVHQEFQQAREECSAKQKVCQLDAPLEDEEGNPLPLRQEMEDLGLDTLDQVEVAKEEASAKANDIAANPDVIRQYEIRKKQIEELEVQVENMVQAEAEKTAQLERNRKRWERKLEEQIAIMNGLFSKYMSEMGNAGELMLYKGERGEDGKGGCFKDWGIQILVSFRGEAKAQVLSAQSHSGGERAVSTIMYLMGCQDMLVSPFRCVDEINQGLDERNERLVFRRIVTNSCSLPGSNPLEHSGQYFLITPKLLPNLEDMEHPGVTVLTVFNGPYNEIEELKCDHLLSLAGSKRPIEAAESDDENQQGNIMRRTKESSKKKRTSTDSEP